MVKLTAKATCRKRSRRIQKKIDKRYGYLHISRRAYASWYIIALSGPLSNLAEGMTEASKGLNELGKEMMQIVTDATLRR